MKRRRSGVLIVKVLLLGALLAGLAWLFHPQTGTFTLLIDGEPVAEPLARIAAVPTVLALLFMVAVVTVLMFFGAGLLLLLGTALITVTGIGFVAPFLWPLLVVVVLVALVVSLGTNGR